MEELSNSVILEVLEISKRGVLQDPNREVDLVSRLFRAASSEVCSGWLPKSSRKKAVEAKVIYGPSGALSLKCSLEAIPGEI